MLPADSGWQIPGRGERDLPVSQSLGARAGSTPQASGGWSSGMEMRLFRSLFFVAALGIGSLHAADVGSFLPTEIRCVVSKLPGDSYRVVLWAPQLIEFRPLGTVRLIQKKDGRESTSLVVAPTARIQENSYFDFKISDDLIATGILRCSYGGDQILKRPEDFDIVLREALSSDDVSKTELINGAAVVAVVEIYDAGPPRMNDASADLRMFKQRAMAKTIKVIAGTLPPTFTIENEDDSILSNGSHLAFLKPLSECRYVLSSPVSLRKIKDGKAFWFHSEYADIDEIASQVISERK